MIDRTYETYLKYKGLLINESKKFLWSGMEIEELMQMAYFGVNSAVKTFDCNSDIPFVVHLKICVRRTLFREIHNSQAIKIPEYMELRIRKYFATVSRLQRELSRMPYNFELAKQLDCPIDEITKLEALASSYTTSLDELETDTFATTETGFSEIEENEYMEWFWYTIKELLSEEQYIVILLYFKKQMTLRDISKVCDTSIETVRKRKESALIRLKKLYKNHLSDFDI